ncbi:MAG: DUF3108 domain-containing protein [Saprospiraceae bacterium]
MRVSIIIILSIALLTLTLGKGTSSVSSIDAIDNPCKNTNTSFISGEKLIYKLYYNWKFVWIPAGEITFEVQSIGDKYQMTGIGKSYSSYDNFFRVRDYYEVIVDTMSLSPISFVRHIEEGNYRKFDSLYFDQSSNLVHSFNGKNKATAKTESYEIDPCMMDLISVFYKLRNTDTENYKPGSFLDFNMFLDREIYPIHVVYEKNENKKIKDLGTYNCLKIRPELIVGNIFKEGDVMNVWVSNDKNKIPLMIESPISVGSVKGVLKNYSGLRHPFLNAKK